MYLVKKINIEHSSLEHTHARTHTAFTQVTERRPHVFLSTDSSGRHCVRITKLFFKGTNYLN